MVGYMPGRRTRPQPRSNHVTCTDHITSLLGKNGQMHIEACLLFYVFFQSFSKWINLFPSLLRGGNSVTCGEGQGPYARPHCVLTEHLLVPGPQRTSLGPSSGIAVLAEHLLCREPSFWSYPANNNCVKYLHVKYSLFSLLVELGFCELAACTEPFS